MSMELTRTVLPSVFGNGLLGNCVTGLLRIPAFMSNCVAVMMVGELTIRGLGTVFESIGFKPAEDSFVQQTAKSITDCGVRPYKNYPADDLALRAIAFTALGIAGSEFVRLLGGSTPAIYNNILSFLGPLRLESRPYLAGVEATMARIAG